MFRRFRLVIAGIALIAANQAVSFAVQAAMPSAFLPAGATRYSVVSSMTTPTTTSTSYANMPDTATSITIPSGKHGDVLIFYCGEIVTDGQTYVRALVGGSVATPSYQQLQASPEPGSQSRCVNFYKTGVGAGTKSVRIQWANFGMGQTSTVSVRSMIVIVNIR